MKPFIVSALFVVISVFMASCQTVSPNAEEPVTLKVLAFNSESFRSTYGNYYMAVQDRVNLEVISIVAHIQDVSDFDEVAQRLYQEHKPDLIALPTNYIANLDEAGLLASLDLYIQKEKMDLTTFSPAIIEYLTNDQHQLIGLAPTFTGSALYYNKALFREQGLAEPVNFMTWEGVFELAKRFPTPDSQGSDDAIYGFSDNALRSPMLMALQMGGSQRLSIHDGNQFTFHTPAWTAIFDSLASCLTNLACHSPDRFTNNEATSDRIEVQRRVHPFLQGNVAMSHDTSDLYHVLASETSSFSNLEWGIVSSPVSSQYPDTGGSIRLDTVFAIPIQSDKQDQSWDFISYIFSDRFQRVLSFTGSTSLPARPALDMDDNLSAFYRLPHIASSADTGLRRLPGAVVAKFDHFSNTYFQEILSGQISVADALSAMEAELQVIYNNERTAEDE